MNPNSGSQTVNSRPAAQASPGNLLEVQIFRPHPRLTESDPRRGHTNRDLPPLAGDADTQ